MQLFDIVFQNCACFGMGIFNNFHYFSINLAGSGFRAGKRSIAAQICVGNGFSRHHVKLISHAKACDHSAGNARCLFNIVAGACGNAFKNNFFRTAPAGKRGNFIEQFFLAHQHIVVLANLHGVA